MKDVNIKMNFIVDEEINLNEYDFLKTKVYADTLTNIINNINTNKVFTIGLFGNWGTGKSSIVKTSENNFNNKNIKFVTYDAWKYVNDPFRRMFLRKLKDDLNFEETYLMRKFYENESMDIGDNYRIGVGNIIRTILILCLIFLIGFIVSKLPFFDSNIETKITLAAIVSFVSFMFTIISGVLYKLNISVTKPHIFSPEQFEDCFKEIITHSLKKINCIEKTKRWINDDKAIKNLDKLVIVIDNIDRCSSDIAYNLLTDIKTFLGSEPYNIIFVIPVDDQALRKHIIGLSKNMDKNNDNDIEEFLRKFFNAVIRIKPYGETDIYSFAKNISEKTGLELKNETINLATKEYSRNPRRVIQLFNNLLVEFSLYHNHEFIQKNETLICAILILREEFNEYYQKILNFPKLLIDWEPEIENTENITKFNRFVRILHNSVETIELSVLNTILSNSTNIFSSEIRDSINTFNIKKILEIFESNRNHIIDCLIDKMEFAIKNKLIKIELSKLFDISCQINNEYQLEKHENIRILEKISNNIEDILTTSKVPDEMCTYAISLKEQGLESIFDYIIIILTRNYDNQRPTYWKPLFNATLRHFRDKAVSEKLSIPFSVEYKSVDNDIEFSMDQWNYLISDEFVQHCINEIDEIKIDSGSHEIIHYLFSGKKNISVNTYSIFFNKIKELIGNLRGKTKDEILNIVLFLNSLLVLIPNGKLKEEPKEVYELIINDRKIPNPRNPHPQYDTSQNFISECLSEQQNVNDIITFAINIYRITNNITETNNLLKKIMEKNRNELNEKLIELTKQEYTLKPILYIIFEDKEYTNENTIALLKHCFYLKDDKGNYSLPDNDVKEKLDDMLNFAFNNNSMEIYNVLETVSEEKKYKDILSGLIVKKESSFINNLSDKLLELAVGSLTEENYEDFSENYEFLSVVAIHGINSQKKLLIKILLHKIDKNIDIENILKIVNLIENIYEIDPDGLLSTHLRTYKRENKEDISEEIKKQLDSIIRKLKVVEKNEEN